MVFVDVYIDRTAAFAVFFILEEVAVMAEKKKKTEGTGKVIDIGKFRDSDARLKDDAVSNVGVVQDIDAGLFLSKLISLIEESGSIAGYIGDTVQYGRALGYAEGKLNAYVELLDRVLEGEFGLIGKEV